LRQGGRGGAGFPPRRREGVKPSPTMAETMIKPGMGGREALPYFRQANVKPDWRMPPLKCF